MNFFVEVLTVEVEIRDEYGEMDSRAVPFKLEPWECFIIGSLFGWKTDAGLRRFRRAYVEVGKGNGKSPLAAGIGHYMLTATGKIRAEVYSAATDKDQAAILFRDAVSMWDRSPGLKKRLVSSGVNPVWQLTDLSKASFFKPISSEKKGKSGIRPYCALIDEIHEHTDNSVIEMLRAGTKGNQDALIFEITNSGFDRNSVCYAEHDYSVRVVTGVVENDNWFAFIASLDTGYTEQYSVDIAVEIMAKSCSCNAKITLSESPVALGFVPPAISDSVDPRISNPAKDARSIPIATLLQETFVIAATNCGLKRRTLLIDINKAIESAFGQRNTPKRSRPQANDIERRSDENSRKGYSVSASRNTELLSISPENLRSAKTIHVAHADWKGLIFELITAIAQELSADSFVINAMRESVCSAIVSRLYNGHSDTCRTRQLFSFKNGSLNHEIPDDDPFEDESCWIKANPNLGVSIQLPFIREQVVEAKGMPSKEGLVRRLHFCEWTESESSAIPRKTWKACEGEVDPEALCASGIRPFGGLDLSRAKDLTAFTLTWVLDATPDKWQFASKTWFWTPKDTLAERAKRDRAPYVEWEKQGFIEAVPGKRISYRWVADALAGLCTRYDPQIIGCDQYGLEQLQDQLSEIGADLPCVVHPQGFQERVIDEKGENALLGKTGAEKVKLWMPDSILKLEAALLEQRITVDPNPQMASCAAGVVYEENRTGHRMFAKHKATHRIDGMVSLAMSVGVATVAHVKKQPQFQMYVLG